MREAIGDLVGSLPRDRYSREVSAQDKVLYELIIAGRREDAATLLEQDGHDLRRFATALTPAGIRADLPFTEGLPDDTALVSDAQLHVFCRAMQIFWTDSGDLEIVGWAYIRFIDLADHPPTVELTLVGEDGSRAPLVVEQRTEPRLDVLGEHWHCDYTPGGFRAVLPDALVPTAIGRWHIEVTVTAAGVTRSHPLDGVSFGGSAGVTHCRVDDGGRLTTVSRPGNRVQLVVTESPVYATSAELDGAGDLTVDLVSAEPVRALVLGPDDRRQPVLSATPRRTGPTTWSATLATGAARAAAAARPGYDAVDHPVARPGGHGRRSPAAAGPARRAPEPRGERGGRAPCTDAFTPRRAGAGGLAAGRRRRRAGGRPVHGPRALRYAARGLDAGPAQP